jgi:hypothetical protein
VPSLEQILCRGRFRHPGSYRRIPGLSTVCTRTVGATVVSSFGSPIGSYGFPKIDAERKKINDFIRIGGLFDAATLTRPLAP